MEMGIGGALGFVPCEAPAPAVLWDVPADEGILLLLVRGRSRASPVVVELKVEGRLWEEGVVGSMIESRTGQPNQRVFPFKIVREIQGDQRPAMWEIGSLTLSRHRKEFVGRCGSQGDCICARLAKECGV